LFETPVFFYENHGTIKSRSDFIVELYEAT